MEDYNTQTEISYKDVMKDGFIISIVVFCAIPVIFAFICYFSDNRRNNCPCGRRSKKYVGKQTKRPKQPETESAIKLQETNDWNISSGLDILSGDNSAQASRSSEHLVEAQIHRLVIRESISGIPASYSVSTPSTPTEENSSVPC